MLAYLGVILLLAGALSIIVASLTELNMFSLTLGIVMVSMGLVLSYVASKVKNAYGREMPTYPLSYAHSQLESYQDKVNKTSSNRAFGFVLISMALFILTVSGVFGFFMFWPLTLLGACCMIGGVMLCIRK